MAEFGGNEYGTRIAWCGATCAESIMTCLAGRRWPGEEVFLQLRLNLVQNLGLADPDPVLGKGSLERARQVENLGSEGVSGSLEVALQEWRSRRMAERPPGKTRAAIRSW